MKGIKKPFTPTLLAVLALRSDVIFSDGWLAGSSSGEGRLKNLTTILIYFFFPGRTDINSSEELQKL